MKEIIEVAVGPPVFKTFHYRIPEKMRDSLQVGMRVLVPFDKIGTDPKKVFSAIPLGRLGIPEEVASVVVPAATEMGILVTCVSGGGGS